MNFLWFGKSLKDSIAAPLVIVSRQDFLFEPDFDKVPTLHCLNPGRGLNMFKFENDLRKRIL